MLEIAIHNPRQHRQFHHNGGPFTLFRSRAELPLWSAASQSHDDSIAQVEILPQPQSDNVLLTFAGCEAQCHCGHDRTLAGKCQVPFPAHFAIGDTHFEIVDSQKTSQADARPLERLHGDASEPRHRRSNGSGPSTATLSRWFAALGKLNHWATSLQELYVQAAECAVEAIGLDGAMVCRLRDGQWEIAASHLPHPDLGIHVEPTILDELLNSPTTLFHGTSATKTQSSPGEPTAGELSNESPSAAVVISPLRSSAGGVVGAIYGYRSVRTGNARRGIRYLEAHWIELLAGAVSDAMLRLERESQVDRRRVLLKRTALKPGTQDRRAMAAETREVTLLFADLRDFTRRSESLEMDVVYELLGQVMDALTAAVMDHDGLVLDYYGDGLAAMWNAPADQIDHAELACRAGLRMLESMPELSRDWSGLIHGSLQLGVGVHTGTTRVGNAGSRHRAKYGPRGTNVNLTSRVEAATKEIGVPLLITSAVANQLSNQVTAHRVCVARVPGIETPVELFSVQSIAAGRRSASNWHNYEQALHNFEVGDLLAAANCLATIDQTDRDIPTRFLTEHVQRELGRQENRRSTDGARKPFSGVITLSTK